MVRSLKKTVVKLIATDLMPHEEIRSRRIQSLPPPVPANPCPTRHHPDAFATQIAFGFHFSGCLWRWHYRWMQDLEWFVAHTRPRKEKKLKHYCEREAMLVTLPCYTTVHKYRGKTVSFEKPLFPGYVFLQLLNDQRQRVQQNDHVAKLLIVHDQQLFVQQLGEILKALGTELEIWLAPEIGTGSKVKVRSGPLRGFEGWVEARYGMSTVLLRLDFIGKAAAVKVEADQLEMI